MSDVFQSMLVVIIQFCGFSSEAAVHLPYNTVRGIRIWIPPTVGIDSIRSSAWTTCKWSSRILVSIAMYVLTRL